MTAVRELFAEYGIKFDTKPLERGIRKTDEATDELRELDSVTEAVSDGIRSLGAAIAGVFAVGAMRDMVSTTIEATNQISRWSQRLQLSTQEVVSWSRVAEPFGADIEDVADAFKELQLKAQDALTGGTSQAEMFRRIGISLDDLRPVVNSTTDTMDLFLRKLDAVNDEGLRNFTVDELMSDAGTRMIPIFAMGSERLRNLRSEMASSTKSTVELAKRTSEWAITSGKANAQVEDLRATIVLAIMPALERAAKFGGDLAEAISEIARESRLLEAAAVTLGGVLVGVAVATLPVWGPMALTVAGVTAAVVLLVAAVDDLWVTIDGGDSITRRTIDSLLGFGATTQIIGNVKQAFVDLKDTILDVWDFVSNNPLLRKFADFATLGPARRAIGRAMEGDVVGATEQLIGADEESLRRAGHVTGALARGDIARAGRIAVSEFVTGRTPSRRERERERSRMRVARTRANEQAWQREEARRADEAMLQNLYQLNPVTPLSASQTPSQSNVTIDNPVTITIQGGDPKRTAEEVREVIRTENARQLRQTREALVSQ